MLDEAWQEASTLVVKQELHSPSSTTSASESTGVSTTEVFSDADLARELLASLI